MQQAHLSALNNQLEKRQQYYKKTTVLVRSMSLGKVRSSFDADFIERNDVVQIRNVLKTWRMKKKGF